MLLVNTWRQVADIKLSIDFCGLCKRHGLYTLQNVGLRYRNTIGSYLRALLRNCHFVDDLTLPGWTVKFVNSVARVVLALRFPAVLRVTTVPIVIAIAPVVRAAIAVIAVPFVSVRTSASGPPSTPVVLASFFVAIVA